MIRKGTKVILKMLPGASAETDIPAQAIQDEDTENGVIVAVSGNIRNAPQLVVYVETKNIAVVDDERWKAQVEAMYQAGEAATQPKK